MSAVAALAPDSQLSRFQIDIIKQNEHPFRRKLVELHGLLNRLTAEVHKGGRLQQQGPHAAQPAFPDDAFKLDPFDLGMIFRCNGIQSHKSGIVPGAFVLSARISKSGYQKLYRAGRGNVLFPKVQHGEVSFPVSRGKFG